MNYIIAYCYGVRSQTSTSEQHNHGHGTVIGFVDIDVSRLTFAKCRSLGRSLRAHERKYFTLFTKINDPKYQSK
jgi:hypothetical protein